MKNYLNLIVLLLISYAASAQTPKWLLNEYSSGTRLDAFYENHTRTMPAIDSAGNVFIAMQYKDSLYFNNTLYQFNNKGSVMIAKYDVNGVLKWNINAQTDLADKKIRLNDLFAMSDGGWVLTGQTQGDIVFSNGHIHKTGWGIYDDFIIRGDANGNILYSKQLLGVRAKVRPGYGCDLLVGTTVQSPDQIIYGNDSFMPPQKYNNMILQLDKTGKIIRYLPNIPYTTSYLDDPWGNLYVWANIDNSNKLKPLTSAFDTVWGTKWPLSKGYQSDDYVWAIGKDNKLKWWYQLDSVNSNFGWYRLGLDKKGHIYFATHVTARVILGKDTIGGNFRNSLNPSEDRALLLVLDTSGKLLRHFFDTSLYPYEEQNISIFPTSYLGDNVEFKVWTQKDFHWPKKVVATKFGTESIIYNYDKDTFYSLEYPGSMVIGRNVYNPYQYWGIPRNQTYTRNSMVFLNSDVYYNTGGNNFMGFYFDENPLNVTSKNAQKSINIYPNPAHTSINIESASPMQALKIYTMDGKLVFETRNLPHPKSHQQNIEQLKNGIYVVEISATEGKTSKLISIHR